MTDTASEIALENPLLTGTLFSSEKVLSFQEASALYRTALQQEKVASSDVQQLEEQKKGIEAFLGECIAELKQAQRKKAAAEQLVEETQELILMLAEKEVA